MRLKYIFTQKFLFFVAFSAVSVSFLLHAYSTGITGVTPKNGVGCNCHNPTSSSNVNVVISGPTQLTPNQMAEYTLTVSGGPLVAAGTNIAASVGTLTAGTGMQKIGDELTHTSPKQAVDGIVTFTFNYTAPATPQTITLYGAGNSVNLNGGNDGDQWNFATNFSVEVSNVIPVELTSFTSQVVVNDVILNWATASETNNAGFNVERKGSSAEWTNVGFITGNGTTSELSNYSYADRNLSNGTYNYRLKQIDLDGSSKYYNLNSEIDINSPNSFELSQNYPNPFNPSTVINFRLEKDEAVTLKIYDISGKEIAQLVNSEMKAGNHSIVFDASSLSSGTYLYELISGNQKAIKKLILIK
ncbi:MAG TPA: T9SS type A sorting domain-containing protein [Ignavibacteriaceae bacterium]|nr:T9SS type A sorting domain-containing protein [Ignavibacteriaceae bacterium]